MMGVNSMNKKIFFFRLNIFPFLHSRVLVCINSVVNSDSGSRFKSLSHSVIIFCLIVLCFEISGF